MSLEPIVRLYFNRVRVSMPHKVSTAVRKLPKMLFLKIYIEV